MTYKEESYLLDNIKQIAIETHESNIMLRQICSYIRYVYGQRGNDEQNAFEQNVLANIMSEILDGVKGKLRRREYGNKEKDRQA